MGALPHHRRASRDYHRDSRGSRSLRYSFHGWILMSRVVIGYIHPLMIHAPFVGSLMKIAHRERLEVMDIMSGANVSRARNLMVEAFLKTDGEYLLMLDSDMVF